MKYIIYIMIIILLSCFASAIPTCQNATGGNVFTFANGGQLINNVHNSACTHSIANNWANYTCGSSSVNYSIGVGEVWSIDICNEGCVLPENLKKYAVNTVMCKGNYYFDNRSEFNANGITIDCNNSKFYGDSGNDGIYAFRKAGWTLKNCQYSGYRDTLRWSYADNVTVENIRITNNTRYGASLVYCDNNTLINISMIGDGTQDEAFHLFSNNTLISNSYVYNYDDGIVMTAAEGQHDNSFINNMFILVNTFGIVLDSDPGNNFKIINNTFMSSGRAIVLGAGTNWQIENNSFHNNDQYLDWIPNAGNVLFKNNIYTHYHGRYSENDLINNITFDTNTFLTTNHSIGAQTSFFDFDAMNNASIINNIFDGSMISIDIAAGNNTKNIYLFNNTFRNGDIGIRLRNGVTNVTIYNNTFRNMTMNQDYYDIGILLINVSDINVSRNNFEEMSYGITCRGCDGSEINYNSFDMISLDDYQKYNFVDGNEPRYAIGVDYLYKSYTPGNCGYDENDTINLTCRRGYSTDGLEIIGNTFDSDTQVYLKSVGVSDLTLDIPQNWNRTFNPLANWSDDQTLYINPLFTTLQNIQIRGYVYGFNLSSIRATRHINNTMAYGSGSNVGRSYTGQQGVWYTLSQTELTMQSDANPNIYYTSSISNYTSVQPLYNNVHINTSCGGYQNSDNYSCSLMGYSSWIRIDASFYNVSKPTLLRPFYAEAKNFGSSAMLNYSSIDVKSGTITYHINNKTSNFASTTEDNFTHSSMLTGINYWNVVACTIEECSPVSETYIFYNTSDVTDSIPDLNNNLNISFQDDFIENQTVFYVLLYDDTNQTYDSISYSNFTQTNINENLTVEPEEYIRLRTVEQQRARR